MDIALTEQRVGLAGTLRGAATTLPGPAGADSPPSGSCPLPHSLPSLPLSLSPPLSSFGHLWAGFWSGWVAWLGLQERLGYCPLDFLTGFHWVEQV